jgi:hypothetical protein
MWNKPYAMNSDQHLTNVAHACLFFTIMFGLLLKSQMKFASSVIRTDNGPEQVIAEIVLVLAHGIVILYGALSIVYENVTNLERRLHRRRQAALAEKEKELLGQAGVNAHLHFKTAEEAMLEAHSENRRQKTELGLKAGKSKAEVMEAARHRMEHVFAMKAAAQMNLLLPQVKAHHSYDDIGSAKEALAMQKAVGAKLRIELSKLKHDLTDILGHARVKVICAEALTHDDATTEALAHKPLKPKSAGGNPFDAVPDDLNHAKKKKKKHHEEKKHHKHNHAAVDAADSTADSTTGSKAEKESAVGKESSLPEPRHAKTKHSKHHHHNDGDHKTSHRNHHHSHGNEKKPASKKKKRKKKAKKGGKE